MGTVDASSLYSVFEQAKHYPLARNAYPGRQVLVVRVVVKSSDYPFEDWKLATSGRDESNKSTAPILTPTLVPGSAIVLSPVTLKMPF